MASLDYSYQPDDGGACWSFDDINYYDRFPEEKHGDNRHEDGSGDDKAPVKPKITDHFYITILGLHPFKETVYLSNYYRMGLAYYLDSSKVQYLGNMMRTSPCWTHRRHGLPQVAIRSQLSCHVALGFSRHVVTVITFSYDIETGRSWMHWKWDDDAVVLDLVPAPEGPWIILCDHSKVLRHLFGPTWPLSCRALSPSCGRPTPGRPQP